jgi:hypothetical protein
VPRRIDPDVAAAVMRAAACAPASFGESFDDAGPAVAVADESDVGSVRVRAAPGACSDKVGGSGGDP